MTETAPAPAPTRRHAAHTPEHRRQALGPVATLAVVAVAVAVAVLLGVVGGTAPIAPWGIAIIILLLAAGAGTNRVWLPDNLLLRHVLLALVGAGLLLLFSDHVSAFGNYEIAQVAYFAIAVAGLTVLTGHSGQLSLGHGALMAVGAYAVALLMVHQPHVPIVVALLVAIAATVVVGGVLGVAAARLRGPYLAGVTLTFALAIPEIATHYRSVFGADQGKTVRQLGVPGWLSTTFAPEKWLAWVCIGVAAVALVLLANLVHSGAGRRVRCVRDDEIAASLVGINVSRSKVLAFVVSAAAAGLAGGLYGFWAGVVNPGAFALTLSLSLVTAMVIGGTGSLIGAVWGAIALVFVPKYTDSISKHFQLSTATKDNLPLAIYGAALI
ncbi:MAG TPA: branched-chain amino acid ABC transporter permease, partial [Acidimicrobiales bacterium]|nr:branched-chain amino acid ABC transporter permease [Acidimicrobiales bacterium]